MATSVPVRTNWHPDKKYSDVERWVCIYPAYINSKKTRQQGRRLPKENCVENPTYLEMRDVLSATNLHFALENKQYCRERSRELQFRGRVRVQLRNDDGTLFNQDFPTREAVMLHLASKIPQLKTRLNKTGSSDMQHMHNIFYASGGVSNVSNSSGTNSGGGKKGKGKRR